jgi:hypothetical protein
MTKKTRNLNSKKHTIISPLTKREPKGCKKFKYKLSSWKINKKKPECHWKIRKPVVFWRVSLVNWTELEKQKKTLLSSQIPWTLASHSAYSPQPTTQLIFRYFTLYHHDNKNMGGQRLAYIKLRAKFKGVVSVKKYIFSTWRPGIF